MLNWSKVSGGNYSTLEEAIEYAKKLFSDSTYYAKKLRTLYDARVCDASKEVIPFDEFCANVIRANDVLNAKGVEANYDYYNVAKNIVGWVNEKASHIKAIKACPDYNPAHPYKIVTFVDAERVMDYKVVNGFINWFNPYLLTDADSFESLPDAREALKYGPRACIIAENADTEDAYYTSKITMVEPVTKWEGNTAVFEYKIKTYPSVAVDAFRNDACCEWIQNVIKLFGAAKITSEMVENYNAIVKSLCEGEYPYTHAPYKFIDKVKELHPHQNEKTSRFVRKLLKTAFGFVEEKEFASYADAINPVIFKRMYVLSADCIDYLLMSYGTDWDSCHKIWSDGDEAGGCYSGGVWSYMNDGVSLVGYTVPNDTSKDYEFVKKITRQMVFTNGKDLLITVRVYPQSNDNDLQKEVVYREHRNYAQTIVSKIFGISNNWKSKVKDDSYTLPVDTGYHARQYEDYFAFPSLTHVSIPTEIIEDKSVSEYCNHIASRLTIGGIAYCPICGTDLSDEGTHHYACRDCVSGGTHCAGCGCSIDEDEAYYYNGDYYCGDCVFYDEYAGEYLPYNCFDTIEVCEESGWGVVNYWYSDRSISRAKRNGEIFYDAYTESYWTMDTPHVKVNACAGYDYLTNTSRDECISEGTLVVCAECGEYIWASEADVVNGVYYCDSCGTYARERLADSENANGNN